MFLFLQLNCVNWSGWGSSAANARPIVGQLRLLTVEHNFCCVSLSLCLWVCIFHSFPRTHLWAALKTCSSCCAFCVCCCLCCFFHVCFSCRLLFFIIVWTQFRYVQPQKAKGIEREEKREKDRNMYVFPLFLLLLFVLSLAIRRNITATTHMEC